MGKFSCCVPGCTNNWRNSPKKKFHTLPSDTKVRRLYEKLIRNENLKLNAQHTRICGDHFPDGERMCRTQLPSIFPWTATPEKRRVIEKHEVPSTTKKIRKGLEACELRSEDVFAEEIENNVSDNEVPVSENIDFVVCIDQACQTEDFRDLEDLKAKIETLNKEIEALNKENEDLKKNIRETNSKPKFDIEDYKSSDEDISFYTGFPNYDTLILCFDLLKEKAKNLCYSDKGTTHFDPSYNKPGSRRKLSVWQEFTMVLLRLRLGLFTKELADRFRVSVSTVSSVCRTWIMFMRKELEPICIQWPSKEQTLYYMPPVFKSFSPDLVSIIDCTELQMESPSSLDKRSLCYSSYKSRTTMKSLIGITPNGVVSFCSDLYCGSISDPQIVKQSGYLQHLNRGDLVMADKGFTIQDELASVGAKLALPHFMKGKKQFTKEESEHNKKIASLRIHVERYMERLKNWHFFDRPIPISMSDIASDTWIVVACFSNFLPPIDGVCKNTALPCTNVLKALAPLSFKTLTMENETNGLADSFVAWHTIDSALRQELLSRNQNGSHHDHVTMMGAEFAGSNNTANVSPAAGSPSTVVFPTNPQATSSFASSLLSRRPWNVESLDSTNNSPLALVQGVARATDQMNRVMQEKEQRELDRVQLRMDQNRRETEIRMRRNREMRERERREIRRSSGWRDWQEAVPGPWCSCSLDEFVGDTICRRWDRQRYLTVGSSNPGAFSTLYKSLVRLVLEYAAPVWNPYLVKDVLVLERVQRSSSRLSPGKKRGEMEYDESLRKLKWPTLETRRLFLSLVECNNIVFDDMNKPNFDDLFEFTECNSTPANH
ncbi:THAP domain-containing protein 11 [Stylophora pistillata]|uniref:THAP domain-containing protein 11 n=1 Tax=Stylophora pistillata TaxID=50429 RepID=A0A2B4SB35_STYPI|nr:THAP domain-containing protein 11 [Stylophora pistillata]